jgi:hypothetical protein
MSEIKSIISVNGGDEVAEGVSSRISRLKEIAMTSAILEKNGMRPKVEIEIGSGWGTTYERGFVTRVGSGNVTMSEILAQPGTPLTDPLDWPSGLRKNPRAVLLEILPIGARKLLDLTPTQLATVVKLQREEGRLRDVYKKNRENLASKGFPETGYGVNWGLPTDVVLLNGKEVKVYEFNSAAFSHEGRDETVKFGVNIATNIPYLFYRLLFEGNSRTGKGGLSEDFIVLTYEPWVTEGWDEWFARDHKLRLKGSL